MDPQQSKTVRFSPGLRAMGVPFHRTQWGEETPVTGQEPAPCPVPRGGHVLGVLSCPCGPEGQLISQPGGPDSPADLIWGGSGEARGSKRDALPTPIFPEAGGADLAVPGSARLPLARPHPLSRTPAIDSPSHRRGTAMEMASRLLQGSIYPKIAESPHCVGIFQQRRCRMESSVCVSTGTYYMDASIHMNPLEALGSCSSPECRDGQGWRVSWGQRLGSGPRPQFPGLSQAGD